MTAKQDGQELQKIKDIVAHFSIGSYRHHRLIDTGLIHQTFQIETEVGFFCLQGLHQKLATDEILLDYQAVTSYLDYHHFPAPKLILTKEAQLAWRDEKNTRWRMTTWLEGNTLQEITTEQIRSAASMLGRFHTQMLDFDYHFQSEHPLHQSEYHLQALQEAILKHQKSSWLPKIQSYIDEVVEELPKLFLMDLPQRVVHGDPKITNILFDQSGQATALIDLDTCTRHSILVDLGDAIRSWCREGGEDEERDFSLERFEAFIKGYAKTAPKLSMKEINFLPHAGRLITLELTARFLTDILENCYFGWDSARYSSRQEHNYARVKGMLYLAKDMNKSITQISTIIEDIFFPVDSDNKTKL